MWEKRYSPLPTPRSPLYTITTIPRPLAAQYILEAGSRVEKGTDQESRHAGADFVFKSPNQKMIQHIFSDQPSRAGDRSNDEIDICHLVVSLPAVREGVHCLNASCFD